eukprot:jgi/Psemu1/207775/e_gw1.447.33.1
MRRIGTAVGRVASPVVESLDVNAILQQVDWNELLRNVDVDALLEKIDVNTVLERVDVNRHLSRVDYDALVQRSNLEDILARSTAGVMSGFSNLLRSRLAWVDQWASPRSNTFPPRPGRPGDSADVWKNPHELDMRTFGRSIQFRTSGAFNRILYLAIDSIFVWVTFAILAALAQTLGHVFTNDEDWANNKIKVSNEPWFEFVLYSVYNNCYWVFLVGCFGRTIGMWALGLLMVSREGHRVSFLQVVYQVVLLPLNVFCFGWVCGFVRRDGAFLSDLVGGVNIVYLWDVKHIPHDNATMAMSMNDFVDPLTQQERDQLLVDDSDSDSDGDDIGDRRPQVLYSARFDPGSYIDEFEPGIELQDLELQERG